MLDARAGSPPDALTLIERHHVFAGIQTLDALVAGAGAMDRGRG